MAGKLVEYLCLACGTQGTQLVDAPAQPPQGGDDLLKTPEPLCPMCGKKVACFHPAEAAADLHLAMV